MTAGVTTASPVFMSALKLYKAVIGLFDPSARPYLPEDRLSFAVPMAKFIKMVDNMEESFLITATWKKSQARLKPIEKRNKSD